LPTQSPAQALRLATAMVAVTTIKILLIGHPFPGAESVPN
jgi:hypothetical protein